jgi:thymidylate synthase ThyX
MTANARVLEHGISKMLSHPLIEVQKIGEELKSTVLAEVPTLCKYASPHPSLSTTTTSLNKLSGAIPSAAGNDWCHLIDFDPEGENKILAASLYRYGELSFSEAQAVLRAANSDQLERFAEDLLGNLAPHDSPARELEHTTYTFDIILDQGGYAEFKRHRMMTQTAQVLTTRLGYALPRQMTTAGFEHQYRSAMEKAGEAFETLYKWNPQVASYIVPNGFNRRILFTLNLREAFTFCRLRSAATAHFSMRRVAQRVAEEIRKVHPLIGHYLSMPDETWQGIEADYFTPMD